MRVIPVLDMLGGQVVHGIAGRRHHYRPIRSRLTDSTEPAAIADAFRDRFGLTSLYVADLDAIAGAPPSLATYSNLQQRGFSLMIDAGLRTAADATPLLDASAAAVVAGLETLAGPEALTELLGLVGVGRLIFSLDQKNGEPLAAGKWPGADCFGIARCAIEEGIRRVLILDLTRVGMGGGIGTESLCESIKQTWPEVEVLAGGGVSGREDLERLRRCAVDGVLVASALHDGRLRREDV